MKMEMPPSISEAEVLDAMNFAFTEEVQEINSDYPYWDKVKYLNTKNGMQPPILWHALKYVRQMHRTLVKFGKYTFSFMMTDEMFELLHYFDMNIGGNLTGEHLIPYKQKEVYLMSSIMEEAIASSQMEGAATTRKVAKEMLRKSEKPKNRGQQMILNNYETINCIKEIYEQPLNVETLLEIHRSMTKKTLAKEDDEGRFRQNNEIMVVDGVTGEVAHIPPHYSELPELLADLDSFFNQTGKDFIHPIIKGIIIHFMLAYIHPFVDGNGRTARSLFYWYMLKEGYWMIEYMSISRIIYKSKLQYEKSFLYTENDDNDLTYFILYNLRTMKKSFDELKRYLEHKADEDRSNQILINIKGINMRQAQILGMLQEKPNSVFYVKEIENRFVVSNYTARADLEGLVEMGYLTEIRINKIKRGYSKSSDFDKLLKGQTKEK